MKLKGYLTIGLLLIVIGVLIGLLIAPKPKPQKQEPVVIDYEQLGQKIWHYVRDSSQALWPHYIYLPGKPPIVIYETTQVGQVPVEETRRQGSSWATINDTDSIQANYNIVIGHRLPLEYADVEILPLRYKFIAGSIPVPKSPSDWRGMLYAGLGAPIPLDTLQGEAGLFLFYKRIGLYGRAELRPNYELNTLQIKYRVFATVRIF